jgi:hypothetical protein
MAQTCTRCSRPNPADAAFCYNDGTPLAGAARASGALQFHSPLVFPSGRQCHDFEQLARACNDCWDEAKVMLREGFLQSFLGGMGRADLAAAARDAAKFPDADRGLDQFLDKLPGKTLRPPQLQVDQAEFVLGRMTIGEDRTLSLRLKNAGMRLLYGSVAVVDCAWLTVGDGAGTPTKSFQFGTDAVIPVNVRGKALRAGNKPLEGKLVIDSSGGTATVVVRVEVPVKPFPTGALAGALSPRQIAEKAKAAPRDAAALFEQGAVARWYEENGWTYPVQGPAAIGTGAVQQFFEALGLTAPPRVTISERSLSLHGNPGAQLKHTLEVKTAENRVVWAHGSSDQPWLVVGRSRPTGRTVAIPVSVPGVPDRPGETLQGMVVVTANGNQRFEVPVQLTVAGSRRASSRATHPEVMLDVLPVDDRTSANDHHRAPRPVPAAAPAADRDAIQEVLPAVAPARAAPARREAELPAVLPVAEGPAAGPKRTWLHAIPAGVITLALLIVIACDLVSAGSSSPWFSMADNDPRVGLNVHDGKKGDELDNRFPEPTMRFGLSMLKEKDPNNPKEFKRLTFDKYGRSNNVCVRIDGSERLFGPSSAGGLAGKWLETAPTWKDEQGREHHGSKAVWSWEDVKVQVTQTAEIVRGEQSGLLDTCLVRYTIENKESRPQAIGLRVLLDTFIGANDGVPFTIPGDPDLCDTQKTFETADKVPDFIQALENEDLAHPGTVAHLKLKLGGRIEPPTHVILGAWPDDYLQKLLNMPQAKGPDTLWDVPVLSMKAGWPYDSAVTIYWDDKLLPPGDKRELGFTYGLGNVASSGKLLLTVDGTFKPGGELTVVAQVSDPQPDEKVTLKLPAGFVLSGSSAATQTVPPVPANAARRNSTVTWKVKAGPVGSHQLDAESSTGAKQSVKVLIKASSIFD